MRKNIQSILLVVVIVAVLAVFAHYFMKPRSPRVTENPYALNLENYGQLTEDDYCGYQSEKVLVPLKKSHALAVDKDDNVYISGDSSIVVLTATGVVLRQFKTPSTATALVIGADQLLYAAFEENMNVYSSEGELVAEWPRFNKATYITSLAAGEKNLYLADAADAMVYEYTPQGAFVRAFGTKDNKKAVTAFILPSYYFDVAVSPNGTVWVANPGKHKLVNFSADGQLLSYWGESSSAVHGFCGCCNPSHFAILSDGSFITAEKGIVRLKIHDTEGNYQCAVAGADYFMAGSTGLDVATGSNDQIFVLEPDAGIFHIFKK